MGYSTDLNSDSSKKKMIAPLEPDYDVNTKGGEHADDALHEGTWDWHSYILNGAKNERFKERCPKTAAVVDDVSFDIVVVDWLSLFSSSTIYI